MANYKTAVNGKLPLCPWIFSSARDTCRVPVRALTDRFDQSGAPPQPVEPVAQITSPRGKLLGTFTQTRDGARFRGRSRRCSAPIRVATGLILPCFRRIACLWSRKTFSTTLSFSAEDKFPPHRVILFSLRRSASVEGPGRVLESFGSFVGEESNRVADFSLGSSGSCSPVCFEKP